MPTIVSAVTLVCLLLGFAYLALRLRALSLPLSKFSSEYKDALVLISARADKAELNLQAALAQLASFERSVGDKRGLETSLSAERDNNAFLRERLTECQRAIVGLTNPKLEATLVGQTSRSKEAPEPPFTPKTARWVAAGEGSQSVPFWGDKEPLVNELSRRASSSFQGSDLAGLARRESGPTLKVVPDPLESM